MTPHKFFGSRQAGTKKQKKSLPFCLGSINKTGVLSEKITSEMKKRGPDERKNFQNAGGREGEFTGLYRSPNSRKHKYEYVHLYINTELYTVLFVFTQQC